MYQQPTHSSGPGVSALGSRLYILGSLTFREGHEFESGTFC